MTTVAHTVLLFHTSNHALRAEKLLKQAGVACRLIPVPRHLSSDCGVCVRVDRPDRVAAERAVLDAGVDIAGIHDLAPPRP